MNKIDEPTYLAAKEVIKSISSYCRAAINNNLCDEDICELCAMNKAFNLAIEDREEYEGIYNNQEDEEDE